MENTIKKQVKSLSSLSEFAQHGQQMRPSGNLMNSNLIHEMAKTAALLSNQLLELHKSLSINHQSSPIGLNVKNFLASNNFLTPLSSGYSSNKTSCESLNKSTCYSSTSVTDVSVCSEFSATSSTASISIRKCLFNEEQQHQQQSMMEEKRQYLTPQQQYDANKPDLTSIKVKRKCLYRKRIEDYIISKARRNCFQEKFRKRKISLSSSIFTSN
jgi:hypothetical protein